MKKVPFKLKFIFVLVGAIIALPLFVLPYYNYLLSPASKETETVRFVVTPGQPLIQIAQNLQEKKLIRSALAFRLMVAQMGITTKIQAGDYKLIPNKGAREIAQTLTFGASDIWVTFPEGTRIEQQAEILEARLSSNNENLQFKRQQYIQLSKEGYMFPDTYLISKEASAQAVVGKLRETFDSKVSRSLLGKGLKNNLTENQVVILASLLEREAKTNEERPIIAGILLNRIEEGMPLQVDATVQYAKGYDAGNESWWSSVSIEEYQSVRSPYNTYLNTGLPPAPICSPGLESIKAAAQPGSTPYFYYLHDSKGKIHYAKTSQEHNENIRKYL